MNKKEAEQKHKLVWLVGWKNRNNIDNEEKNPRERILCT